MQTFLASPQHVAADHLGRFASRVRLAVLARRNPSAREEDSQDTTLNSNRHYIETTFVSNVVQMPSTFTTTLSKIKTATAEATTALPWWTETTPRPQLFSSGNRRCEWNLVPSHQLPATGKFQ